MKIVHFLVLALVAGCCVAAEPTWNPADAVKEAEQDIRTGHIKFYWAGSIASRPVGVPIEVARKYPQANAGIGCVTNDIPLRERQEEYARRYNEKMFVYISQKHQQPSSNVILSEAKNLGLFLDCPPRNESEMFESLASCFAFRSSAPLNMTALFKR